MPKVIWTIFAGRQNNLSIQRKYLSEMYKRGLLHEVHLWDFTRTPSDGAYLNTAFNEEPFKVIKVANKRSWSEYYSHYTPQAYDDHIIIKCDDDIVYVDIEVFPQFILQVINDEEHCLHFPFIINNGVCAHYQQRYGVLPESEFGLLPYDILCGRLWNDGKLAERVHLYFMKNLDYVKGTQKSDILSHPSGDRISINFFAVKTSKLAIYQALKSGDDEKELTVDIPKRQNLKHAIHTNLFVSHLAFCRQRQTGLNEGNVLQEYNTLADTICKPLEQASCENAL
jgi:hypothetical protein